MERVAVSMLLAVLKVVLCWKLDEPNGVALVNWELKVPLPTVLFEENVAGPKRVGTVSVAWKLVPGGGRRIGRGAMSSTVTAAMRTAPETNVNERR
jgi:hypothetical protein